MLNRIIQSAVVVASAVALLGSLPSIALAATPSTPLATPLLAEPTIPTPTPSPPPDGFPR